MRVIDLTGQEFGRLVVVTRAGTRNQQKTWVVVCACGNLRVVRSNGLRSSRTKSCGCLHKELQLASVLKHGRSNTPEYRAYASAKDRCQNKNCRGFQDYGGRGIRFLFESFEEFFAELGPKPEPKHEYSVDRYPNNDGHYEPGNVRWATRSQQQRNKRKLKVCKRGHVRTPDNVKDSHCRLCRNKYLREYSQTEARKQVRREFDKQRNQTEERKQYMRQYGQTRRQHKPTTPYAAEA